MSLENNTQEKTTSFQFNNYLKAGAVSMLTLGAYAITRATNFLPQWRTQSGATLTEVSQKSESSHMQLQNSEVPIVQSRVDTTSLKSAEGLSVVTEFKEIALELPQTTSTEPQKTETTPQRKLLSQTTVLKPIPDQVINANELYDFSIDVNKIFWPGMQALAITGIPTWMNPNYYPLVQNYRLPEAVNAITVEGTKAYVANGRSGLYILDISNPSNPVLLGHYDTPGTAYKVTVSDNIAYVADGESLQILNVTNPGNPTYLSSYSKLGAVVDVTLDGDLAYVVDDGLLQLLNISDVHTPTVIGNGFIVGIPNQLTIKDGIPYLATSMGVYAYEYVAPVLSTPTLLGQYQAFAPLSSITVVGTTAYVIAGPFQIINVANPAAPTLVGQYNITPEYAQSATVVDTTAYVTVSSVSNFQGIRILNVTNSATPSLLSSCAIGSFGYLTVVGTTAYVTAPPGLRTINVSNPVMPILLGQYTFYNTAGITVVGTTAYLGGAYANVLHIIDVSNPAVLVPLSQYPTLGDAFGVAVVGTTAYVAEQGDFNGLQIVDVSNPTAPILLSSYATPGYAQSVTVVGTTAYVTEYGAFNGLQIINVANPTAPTLLGQATLGNSYAVALVGMTAYVGDGINLSIIRTANLINLGNYPTTNSVSSIHIVNDTAIVALGNGGIQVLSLLDASNPTAIKTASTIAAAQGVTQVGATAYVSDALGNWATTSFKVTIARFPVVFQAIIPPNAFWANKSISFTLPQDTFVDLNNDPLTYNATLANQSPLPAWLVFSANNLTFSGTPSNIASLTTFTIQVTAVNPLGGYVSATFPLVIQANVPPTLINLISSQSASVGVAFKFVIPQGTFVDSEGDILTYRATLSDGSPLPTWLSFDGNTFSGVPGRGDTGFYSTKILPIFLTAEDGKFSTSTTFNINVGGVSGGELFVKIAAPLLSVAGFALGLYRKRALCLNRVNKKKYRNSPGSCLVNDNVCKKA